MAFVGRKVRKKTKPKTPKKVRGVRNKNDWYPTPDKLAPALMGLINFKSGDVLLDPSKGQKGNQPFYDAMPGEHQRLWAEIDEGVDYFENEFSADVIISNPPFNLAERFIVKSIDDLKPDGMLIFLLRLNYMGSQKRFESLWQQEKYTPKQVITLVQRPSFTGDNKTDATEYAFFVFGDTSRMINKSPIQWLSWFDKKPVSDENVISAFSRNE